MGTITDKLNWLYDRKKDIVDFFNYRSYAYSQYATSYGYDSNFSTINSDYMTSCPHRMRLVPVLTLYMQYNYIPASSSYLPKTSAYINNRSESWLNEIIDFDYCSYAIGTSPSYPSISRSGTGLLTTTNSVTIPSAVLNIPFIIGCGPTDSDTNQTTWMGKPLYGDISYYYNPSTTSGQMKILLADDGSMNDGHFILGNISLVDPLTDIKSLGSYAMYCIDVRYFQTSYAYSGTNLQGLYRGNVYNTQIITSQTRVAQGKYTISYSNIGYNNFQKFFVIPLNCLSSSAGSGGKSYATLKSVIVNASTIVVNIITSNDSSLNDAPFGLMLFAKS